jgi:poly(3-hydroxybutyrate) depolymerase
MIAAKYLFGLTLVLPTIAFAPSAAQADDPPLGAYNADIGESSISGISSGAFMAVQFATAWSDIMKGVGIIAGGPYYCAQATAVGGLTGDIGAILTATGPCMVGPPPALEPLIKQTDDWARNGDIDDTRHIAGQKIYIFDGYNDAVVNRTVTDATHRFYLHYLSDRNRGNLFYQTAIGAGHSQVTLSYGLECSDNKDYFIDQCNYDQAGVILQHIYGALRPRNDDHPLGELLIFDQREFTLPASPASYSLAETGYAYVPASCAALEPCRVHIALHGCKQNYDAIGDRYVQHAGYNEWADTNHLIILYPQTIAGDPVTNFGTPLNPYGCWDWWGYTDFNYAVKPGRQISTIKAMLDRLTRGHVSTRSSRVTDATAPDGLRVNDISDTAVALAWTPSAGALTYTAYRASGVDQNFMAIGTVAGPSFGDAGLSPATSYAYKVTVNAGGSEGPASTVVTATTLPVPPRCSAPGSCPIAH